MTQLPRTGPAVPEVPGPASAEDVTVQRMYYTLCNVCETAFTDWTDDPKSARRNRKAHLDWHNRQRP